MPGRIETYMHSDNSTHHKGGSIIELTCQTDFLAKTPEFIAFAKKVAKMAYAVSATKVQRGRVAQIEWKDIVSLFPEMETERDELAKTTKEQITFGEGVILALTTHWPIVA